MKIAEAMPFLEAMPMFFNNVTITGGPAPARVHRPKLDQSIDRVLGKEVSYGRMDER
jgi:hypothetical protein